MLETKKNFLPPDLVLESEASTDFNDSLDGMFEIRWKLHKLRDR